MNKLLNIFLILMLCLTLSIVDVKAYGGGGGGGSIPLFVTQMVSNGIPYYHVFIEGKNQNEFSIDKDVLSIFGYSKEQSNVKNVDITFLKNDKDYEKYLSNAVVYTTIKLDSMQKTWNDVYFTFKLPKSQVKDITKVNILHIKEDSTTETLNTIYYGAGKDDYFFKVSGIKSFSKFTIYEDLNVYAPQSGGGQAYTEPNNPSVSNGKVVLDPVIQPFQAEVKPLINDYKRPMWIAVVIFCVLFLVGGCIFYKLKKKKTYEIKY